MKTLSILIPLLAGVSASAYSELLRGSYHERPRRLDGGVCTTDDNCNENGKCNSIDAVIQTGTCKCDDGWIGDFCDVEQCGKVENCGDNGECNKDECDCDEGYEGDSCEDEISYESRVIVLGVSSKERSSAGCHQELDDLMDTIDDWDDKKLRDLSTVTSVVVQPGHCDDADTSSELERTIKGLTRHRRLKPSTKSRGNKGHGSSKGQRVVLIGMTVPLSDATESCIDEIDDAAKKIKKWKTSDLEDLDGSFIDLGEGECDEKSIERAWKRET